MSGMLVAAALLGDSLLLLLLAEPALPYTMCFVLLSCEAVTLPMPTNCYKPSLDLPLMLMAAAAAAALAGPTYVVLLSSQVVTSLTLCRRCCCCCCLQSLPCLVPSFGCSILIKQ